MDSTVISNSILFGGVSVFCIKQLKGNNHHIIFQLTELIQFRILYIISLWKIGLFS